MANMFVDYARQSAHAPVSKEEELAMLIYNLRAVFTARDIVMEPSYDGCGPFNGCCCFLQLPPCMRSMGNKSAGCNARTSILP